MQEGTPSVSPQDEWANGDAYDPYVGRWSRGIAPRFLDWLNAPHGKAWLDVGSGTGALTETILLSQAPARVTGIDSSEGYVARARSQISDPRVRFEVGDAQHLMDSPAVYDAAVAGLMLNFVPEPGKAVSEMTRVVKPGGAVAAYVWDYAGRTQFLRHFWNAAVALDPAAIDLDEGRRFPLCQPGPLRALFRGAGLRRVEVLPIDVSTDFDDFDDYWSPFLSGQGPAPGYVMSLSEEKRTALREQIRASLPFAVDGSIPLIARAWAVKGERR